MRVKGPEAGGKAPENEDLEKVKGKREFETPRAYPSPRLLAWCKLVKLAVKWVNKQNHNLQHFPHIHIISCSYKMDKVRMHLQVLQSCIKLWQRLIASSTTDNCGIHSRDSLYFFLKNNDSDRDEVE